MGTDDDSGHFGELPQAGFTLSPDSATAFHRFALATYSYRCAITGEQFLPEIIPHPHLDVVPIQPLALGGQVEIGNVVVLEEHVARAFRRGLIQVSDDLLVLIPDRAQLDPRLVKHVVGVRHLVLPDDHLLRPRLAAFSFHRALFAGGATNAG